VQASTEQQGLILELQLIDNEIMQANTKLKTLPEIEQLLMRQDYLQEMPPLRS